MFLLSSDLSLLINCDTLKCNLTPLLWGMRIENSLYIALSPTYKICFIMADFLGLLVHCVNGLISRCSNAQKRILSLSFTIINCIAVIPQKVKITRKRKVFGTTTFKSKYAK